MADRVTHSLVSALRAVPSLSMLDDPTLLAIVGDSANLFWRAGSTVFAKGSRADGLYIVIDGGVRVLDADGGELALLQAGDFFGELSILLHTTHTKSARAVEDTELMVLPEGPFQELLASNPDVDRSIRETAARRRPPTDTPAQV